MRIRYFVCGVVLAGWLFGCKSGFEPCQREMSACLKECEATGGDLNPLPTKTPQNTMTPCETRCQNCRATPSAAPSGTPTPTGTAPAQ
jgi:hypothetical protein